MSLCRLINRQVTRKYTLVFPQSRSNTLGDYECSIRKGVWHVHRFDAQERPLLVGE